jgi:predicted nucleic acid-binding protein
LEAVLSLPLRLTGDGDLHREAMATARELSRPAAYDAHYLALARRLGIELWTTDSRLAQTCREHGLDWVHPIVPPPQT